MRYIGIDPGVSGGIAVVDEHGTPFGYEKMPQTERELLDVLFGLATVGQRLVPPCGVRAVLEFVRASPQMGVVSSFSFGRGYGGIRMALVALKIPYEEATPGKWQQAIGCRTKGDKNVSKRRAQELFPNVKVTHAIADALLLAEYARRLEVRA